MRMATTYPKEGLRHAQPVDLDWLSGSWYAIVGNAFVEEHWSAYRGGMLVGMFRWTEDDKVPFYEIEAIESDGEFVYLRVRHFELGLIAWEEEKEKPHEFLLVEHNDERVVFFELDKPDPRWSVYERVAGNSMRVYFTHGSDPDENPGVFNFTRSARP